MILLFTVGKRAAQAIWAVSSTLHVLAQLVLVGACDGRRWAGLQPALSVPQRELYFRVGIGTVQPAGAVHTAALHVLAHLELCNGGYFWAGTDAYPTAATGASVSGYSNWCPPLSAHCTFQAVIGVRGLGLWSKGRVGLVTAGDIAYLTHVSHVHIAHYGPDCLLMSTTQFPGYKNYTTTCATSYEE